MEPYPPLHRHDVPKHVRDILREEAHTSHLLRQQTLIPPHNPQTPPAPQAKRKSGFWLGVLLGLMLTAMPALLYLFAPKLTLAFAFLTNPIEHYIFWINDLRFWLKTLVQEWGYIHFGT